MWKKKKKKLIKIYFIARDKIANVIWVIDKARGFQKNIYFCVIGYAKSFDCVDHNKL